MIERDYLMRLLLNLAQGIVRSMQVEKTANSHTDSAEMLEAAIGDAVDFDGETFLALAPDSIAQILQISGTDDRASLYIANSLFLASHYRAKAGQDELARIRREQALAVARAFGHELSAFEEEGEEAVAEAIVSQAQGLIDANPDGG